MSNVSNLPAEIAPYVTRTVADANGPKHFLRNGNRAATVDVLGPRWFVQLHVVEGDRHRFHDARSYRSEPRMVAWLREWLEEVER